MSLIGGTLGCRRLYLVVAARHTRSELFEDVPFDGPGGQRLRQTGVPTLALGGGAGVIAVSPIAAANLGRRHGRAARPAKEQALQQCLGRCAYRFGPPRPVVDQARLDFPPYREVDNGRLFAGMDLVAIAHLADVGDVSQQPVQAAAGKGPATTDAAFTGLRLLGNPTPP